MTWYRVGPAGIPGSLKTDMDAVLNKKFGTSTTYAPNTWPDNVNLLGPLPVKTASGVIVSFADGADAVPLASASFGIVPAGGGGTPSDPVAITGYSGMTITHTDGQTPPVESETISDTFGRTVYGGTRALDGTLSETHIIYKITAFDGVWNASNPNGFPVYVRVPDGVHVFTADTCMRSNMFTFTTVGRSAMGLYTYNAYDGQQNVYTLCLPNTVTDLNSANQWLANLGEDLYIIAKIATPNTYALDPIAINSYYGANSIYTDIPGATNSVEYRADISLALQALGGGGRGLMGMMQRPEEEQLTETEEDPEEQPEEAETNER